MTILFLSEKDMKNYGMILGSTLFYTPFAVVGISPCVMVMAFWMVWKGRNGKAKEVLLGIFSYTNIVSVLVVIPIITFYYICNSGYNMNVRFCWEDYGGLTGQIFGTWICFLFLEAGVHICLVAKNEYKNPLFYAVVLSLISESVVSIGETEEVVFRISATMPALFMLMCFVMKTIFGQRKVCVWRIKFIA